MKSTILQQALKWNPRPGVRVDFTIPPLLTLIQSINYADSRFGGQSIFVGATPAHYFSEFQEANPAASP